MIPLLTGTLEPLIKYSMEKCCIIYKLNVKSIMQWYKVVKYINGKCVMDVREGDGYSNDLIFHKDCKNCTKAVYYMKLINS